MASGQILALWCTYDFHSIYNEPVIGQQRYSALRTGVLDPRPKMRALILCLWHMAIVRENYGKEYFTVFRNTVDKEDFDTIGGALLNETGSGYITALTICLRQVKISFCKSVPEQNY